MTEDNGKRAAIVGTGTTRYARSIDDRSLIGLALEAVTKAIANSGLKKQDIDGFIVTPTGRFDDGRIGYALTEHLGIYTKRLCVHNDGGSAAAGFSVNIAQWALEEGRCKYVVLVDAGKGSNAGRTGVGSNFQGSAIGTEVQPEGHFWNQDQIWGGTWVNQFAVVAQRHMHEFGTTEQQLASVAVSSRHNASLNPDAVYQKPISLEDVAKSPMVSTPLRRLMCCMVNDGGSAVVMTTAERARDLPNPPVYVLGSGSAFTGRTLTKSAGGSPQNHFDMVRTVGKLAADKAFDEAGVARSDIDLAAWSDPFVISTIVALEDYGFCGKGEGGGFVGDGGRLTVGGELPVNTNGGWLSGTQASGNHGSLVELVRQLQRGCGKRQVKDADVALFGSIGGTLSNHSVLILGRN